MSFFVILGAVAALAAIREGVRAVRHELAERERIADEVLDAIAAGTPHSALPPVGATWHVHKEDAPRSPRRVIWRDPMDASGGTLA